MRVEGIAIYFSVRARELVDLVVWLWLSVEGDDVCLSGDADGVEA